MSKTSRELIEFCKGKLGTPYVFGMKGQVLTEALLKQLAAENPKVYTPQYITKARSFMGKHCTDCSGLITWCTGILRGSANYKETASEVQPIGALNESMAGWALWKPGHIGVYIGDGTCIEAKGINYGTVETRAQDTPWVSVLKLKDIDYSEQVCESAVPSAHPTGWVKEDGGVRFYLEPERYVANDWYQDKGQWFWFDGSGHAVRNNWYLYKDNWYYFGMDFAMVKGLQLIKGKPYYFNRDGQMAKLGTRFMVQVDKNGVLHFPEEESAESPISTGGISVENGDGREPEHTSPGKTEGKTPALAAYEGSEYTAGAVQPPVTKAGTASEAERKAGHAQGERRISDAGICLIKQFEGCRLEAYRCAAGVPTIGYGHTAGVAMGMKITQAQAEAYLREDLRAFEKAVNKVLECSVTQNQFDALVSFAYNLGAGALRNSTLLKRLHAGDVKGAADEFPKWNKAAGKVLEGLTRRRMMERQLFLS